MALSVYCSYRGSERRGLIIYCYRPVGHLGFCYDAGLEVWWIPRSRAVAECMPGTHVETGKPIDIIE